MKTSEFSESQIVAILKEQESGLKFAEVCRTHANRDAPCKRESPAFAGDSVISR